MPACFRPSRTIRTIKLLRTAALASLTLGALALEARPNATLSPYDRAERMHEALEGRPEQQRTRGGYNRVLDAFRAIYHQDPAAPRAAASIDAVAGLLAEEGRIFQDQKSSNDAIAEYEFLRRDYPESRYRFSGLLTEGEIYRRDLGDRAAAKNVFQTFLKLYPGNALAAQARQELVQISAEEQAERHPGRKKNRKAAPALSAAVLSSADTSPEAGEAPAVAPQRGTVHQPPQTSAGNQPAGSAARQPRQPYLSPTQSAPATDQRTAVFPPQQASVASSAPTPATPTAELAAAEPAPRHSEALNAPPPPRRGRLPLVTGVRHWSTPVYTRVAIDLQDEVQYEAARVPDPDRIFFDLHGARLSPELIGKSVQVTDDGFLKRIRVAQYSNDVSRIVLDVSDVSDYSAFLLPNPYRLIIDIHGRKGGNAASTPGQNPPASTAQTPVPPPSTIKAQPNTNTAAIAPAPSNPVKPNQHSNRSQDLSPSGLNSPGLNSQISRSQSSSSTAVTASPVPAPISNQNLPQAQTTQQDVASLGRQPNRINATRRPTTAPIAASVAGTTAAPQPDSEGAATQPRSASQTPATRQRHPSRPPNEPGIHEAEPTAAGGRSLSRALGLKIGRIVVDAGHGGHDSGTLGPGGIEEKDVVLDVALRLGKMLKHRLGADVIFTRDDDTFIPLETRTAIANKAQADLFISVHANSSQDPDARGVETYYLSFTSSADALEVAARENAVSQQSIHQLADLVKKIAMQDKIDESREFAANVEQSLYDGLTHGMPGNTTLRDRGVKKAPFVVLIGANMPSILAEISFLTNPEDAHQLSEPAYRQRIAESLYGGVARYVSGLSGIRLADAAPNRR